MSHLRGSLPDLPAADRLSVVMDTNRTSASSAAPRAAAFSAAVVALVALLGADVAAIRSHALGGMYGSGAPAVRAIGPAKSLQLPVALGLGWATAALVALLLLLRRSTRDLNPVVVDSSPLLGFLNPSAAGLLRRKCSISYHIGGLYGP